MAAFDYLICLDFEATCWEQRNPDNAEIIEFGAVLLDLKTGEIKSEFHEYVRPSRSPILSDYCKKLTGITQELINRQDSFHTVHSKFLTWLETLRVNLMLNYATPINKSVDSGCNTTFCSWTNWDLQHYLRLDCNRNRIELNPFFKVWIDARKIFERVYPGRYTFADALKFIKITQIGNAHSAINDAKTLSKMMFHLYQRSHFNFFSVTDRKNY